MKHKLTLAVLTLILIFGLSSAAAYADTLTVTLDDPILFVSGDTGGTLTYHVTLSAPNSNGATVFVNGDSFNLLGPPTLDDTDFVFNAPTFLAPGTSDTFEAFTVTVPAGTLPGLYLGSFTFQGGASNLSGDDLGTVNFVTEVTPEPSSFLLLGSGLASLVGVVRRKRAM
jgi:hypothetical protein